MQTNPAEKLFDDVDGFIRESRNLLEQGALLDLHGMDQHVRLLCDSILLLSKEDRAHYSKRLGGLLANLESLAEEMKNMREKLGNEAIALGNVRKANMTYSKVNMAGLPKTPSDDKKS